MPLDIVVGAQWGDEGKGRMVDALSAQADVVARYSGGDNAGHTVTVGEQTFKLHLIPSGIVHEHTLAVMGRGMVINPETLLAEMDQLRQAGVEVSPHRLRISYAAHLITPAHRALDRAQEAARGKGQIGTTLRGIGPAYVDKVARRGLRFADMRTPHAFGEAVRAQVEAINQQLVTLYHAEPLDPDPIVDQYRDYAAQLNIYVDDESRLLEEALQEGKTVLAEGAQGTLLDLDHGTYPYVTSSSPTAPGALAGLGVGPRWVRRVIGVTKAFQTRVGAGPFPTEIGGAVAMALRGTGEHPWDEFGTTTGRPRRVGWLDGVLLRYAVRVNGLTEIALTKLDILTGLHPLRLCVAYVDEDEQVHHDLPLGPTRLERFQPVFDDFPGWEEDVRATRRWSDLPPDAQMYIQAIERLTGLPVTLISVGPEREELIQVERAKSR